MRAAAHDRAFAKKLGIPQRVAKDYVAAEEKRLGEIDYQIKNRIGKARTAWLPGWQISYATSHRKETLIPARDIRTLRVRRLAEADADDA